MFIHSSVGGLLGCFCLLAVVNNAAIVRDVQIVAHGPAFIFWVYRQGGIVESYNNSFFFFSSIINSLYLSCIKTLYDDHGWAWVFFTETLT